MGIILWIIFGALAGWIASLVAGTNEQQGAIANILVGIAGAIIGGVVANLFGFEGVTGFNIWSLLIAIGGSLLLLLIISFFRGRGKTY
jgi:uncharacterized membrane protein YeaQ/YmgE (transglycosylase-associated protein family)